MTRFINCVRNGLMTNILNLIRILLLYKQSNRFGNFQYLGHNTDKIVARHYMGRLNESDLVEIENGEKIYYICNSIGLF